MYCKNCGQYLTDDHGACPNCGVYAGNGSRYCENCGAEAAESASFCSNCGADLKKKQPYGEPVTGTILSEEAIKNIQPRSIVVSIILSIVTCGLYGIYWFIVLTDEVNRLTKNEDDLSGGLAFVLTLVTCGIYGFFWAYKMGQKADAISGTNNSSALVYLLLVVFHLGIVVYALAQDTVNRALENR